MDIQGLIIGLLGLGFVGDIVLHWVLPYRRRKDTAEAEIVEHDADKAEVERLHMQISHQQESLNIYIELERKNAERIGELNKDIGEKTLQIRKLTQQLIDSEHGRNRDKEEIARLTRELGEAKSDADYHRMWRCERTDCKDPRGPRPPRKKLTGLRYEPKVLEQRQKEIKEYSDGDKTDSRQGGGDA